MNEINDKLSIEDLMVSSKYDLYKKIKTSQSDYVPLINEDLIGSTTSSIPALKFSTSGEQTISINSEGGEFKYSFDGETWESLTDEGVDFSGTEIWVKGNNPDGVSTTIDNFTNFVFSTDTPVRCEGNIMSLLGENITEIPCTYCFYGLFSNTPLVSAPTLPAKETTNFCYAKMFSGCSLLTIPPALPATLLMTSCYQYMFENCTSLTKAPLLKAEQMGVCCYFSMFEGCTALTTPPILSSIWLAEFCYGGMFSGCTSLTKAPELPATGLAVNCYNNMFKDCSKLEYINAKFLTTPGEGCTFNWVSGVAENGVFVKNPEATWNVTGVNGIPENWTVNEE